MTLRHRLFTRPRGNFAAMFAMIVMAIAFQLAAPNEAWARAVTLVLQGAVVIAALRAAGAAHRVTLIATGLYVVLAVGSVTAIGLDVIGSGTAKFISLVLVLLAPAAIIVGMRRQLHEEQRVTMQTVFATLGLYLLIGLGFSFAYNVIQDFSNDPFFSGDVVGRPDDFLYFSLITLTTTGYGDFTPGQEIGRAFATIEALSGQIYLVTVISVAVANLRRPLRKAPDA